MRCFRSFAPKRSAARCAAGVSTALPSIRRERAGFNWIVESCYFVRWGYFWSLLQALVRDDIRTFCGVQKVPKSTRGEALRPERFKTFAGYYILTSGGSGLALLALQKGCFYVLNRCERVAVVQTQDCYLFRKEWPSGSSQGQVVDEIRCCTLYLVGGKGKVLGSIGKSVRF